MFMDLLEPSTSAQSFKVPEVPDLMKPANAVALVNGLVCCR